MYIFFYDAKCFYKKKIYTFFESTIYTFFFDLNRIFEKKNDPICTTRKKNAYIVFDIIPTYDLVIPTLIILSVPFQPIDSELDHNINYTTNRHPLNGTGKRKYDVS